VESNGTIVVKVKVPAAGTIALLGTHEDATRRLARCARRPG
jgi:hypothetical protein